ncbi:exodeoxyribonuclease VII large subunit [Litoribrevibacter euphylliae]|uniref:Exodeoxyribonuclease 7 large subunit n=1 Tax=Litoribrevibacter euphylliae TaxID=1834034 RepID=A0ABV7HF95_9GAMM
MLFNRPLSVSELNKHTKDLLETHFLSVEVTGEVSGFVAAASGHWYFTLKDSKAQVKCAMFRGQNRSVIRPPKNGDKVKIQARVTLYEARGDFQLVANALEHDGTGALLAAYERLKLKLEQEGLFAPGHKKLIPAFAREIGVITSPTGAAIQDILHVTQRRFPLANITLYPTQVQGSDAPLQIMSALHSAISQNKCDVLIIGRGGGSIEDLWCFNDEQLARMIYSCPIPIISAVGHEVDFTISDFVADLRAPTPSAAAEVVTPDQFEWQTRFANQQKRLIYAIRQKLKLLHHQLAVQSSNLRSPKQKLERDAQRLDELNFRLKAAIRQTLSSLENKQALLEQQVLKHHPKQKLSNHKGNLRQLEQRLQRAIQQRLISKRSEFQSLIKSLQLISPLNTLERGYSITSSNGKIVQQSDQVTVGEKIDVQLKKGKIEASVTRVE